ncbi:ARM repeat superfamily protein [Artemisia annua]|uniref:ARM repeat superfamily protein n=1 Tax=Artemisia annua TaxID=35608 RepID=A0A2U1PRX7_ARTAN|nr:ARM repeat superfamily protein [Artemisia annua]
MGGRSVFYFFLLLLLLIVVAVSAGEAEEEVVSVNKSTLGLWENNNYNNEDELDGGFPSLDGILHWAIGHSDPAKLQQQAQQHLSTQDDHILQKRQTEIKEVVEKLEEEMPSDSKLMQLAIHDLKNNNNNNLEDALHQLLILVEAIHNANNLHNMGGLSLVIAQLNNSDHTIRTTSAWVVGKAAQNNPLVQNQVLQLGALPKLMLMVKSSFIEEAIKALYAVSAVVRNNDKGIELFYSQGGDIMIQGILSNTTADVRLHRRLVSLIADLAEYQLVYNSNLELPFLNNCALVKVLFDLTTSDDLDLQEKVLLAVKNLLMLESTELLVLDGFCGLKGALERMRLQLQQLIREENDNEYAIDVDGLCKEVNLIYLEKLTKTRGLNNISVSQVPT